MDYHSMKRKELQALCKKHKIPANSANSVLADKLSQLLNEKQITLTQQHNCLKSPVETVDECGPGVPRRQAKKVRFSPTNEVAEYELRNGIKQIAMATETRVRRKSVAKKVDESVVDNVNYTADIVDDGVQAPVKLTRSRVQLLEKDGVVLNNGKKQGRREVRDVEKVTNSVKEPGGNLGRVTRLKVHTLGERGAIQVDEIKQSKRSHKDSEIASESVVEPLVARVKVTGSKTQDVNPQVQKKKGRPRVAKDVKNVEPSKEIMDIPVRVTRSSRQTIKEDIGSTVANLRVEKKRTRREMKASDLSDNLSNVAPEEKQEPPVRNSLRTKGIEVVDEVEDDKVEVINHSRVTRSKVPAMKPSGRNTRSKAENKVKVHRKSNRVQQLEEPLEHAGKKNVSRRKSVMQPGKIEEVLHFEEPVNRPATRRESMMKKALGKEIDKPLVGKRESVSESNIAESPIVATRKSVGKKQLKRQSNNPSTIKEGLDDTENVITQGKDASENEMEAVANANGSSKSRKRSGDPIIEDQIIETEYVFPVGSSSRRSTRSDSRSQGKVVTYFPQNSVAKKQLESILKTRASGGAIIRDGISNKRAKLSRTKINDSEDHPENSNTVGTPILKSVNFDLDEKVTETECTPGIGGSHRRFTHSAIRSDRKVASQSAIKKQLVGDGQLSLHKVTKFVHDPAVNTAPGRVTRSGIKLGGNLMSSFSEKLSRTKLNESEDHAEKSNAVGTPVLKSVYIELDEKVTETERTPGIGGSQRRSTRNAVISDGKEPSQSAIKKQPVGDAQLCLQKVTKFTHDLVVNTVPGRVTRSGIKHGGTAAINFSEKLSRTKLNESEDHAEKSNAVGTPVLKSVYIELDEKVTETERTPGIGGSQRRSTRSAVISDGKEPSQSAIKKQPVGDAQLCLQKVTKFTHDLAVNTVPGRVTRSGIKHGGTAAINFSEKLSRTKLSESEDHAEKYNTERTPVLKSVNFDLDEKVTETERTPDIGGSHSRSTLALISAGKEPSQSAIKDTGYVLTEKESKQNVSTPVGSLTEDNGYSQIEMESELDVSTFKDSLLKYAGKHEASNNSEHDDEDERASTQMQVMHEPVSEDNQPFDMDKCDGAEDVVDAGKELAKEPEFEGVPSTGNDVHEIPVLCKYDGVDGSENTTKECGTDSMPLSGDNMPSEDKIKSKEVETPLGSLTEEISYALIEKESERDVSTCKDSLLNYADKHEASNNSEDDDEDERTSTQMQVMNESVSKDNQLFDMDKCDGVEDVVSAGKELAKEPDFERVPYTSNDVHKNATKECGTDSMQLSGDNMPSDGEDLALNGDDAEDEAFNANREHESNLKPLTDDDSDTALFGEDDDFNITRLFEPTSEPTSSDDMIDTPFSGNDTYGESDNAVDNQKPHLEPLTVNDDVQVEANILPKELETGLETLNADSGLEVPVAGNNVDVDCVVDGRSDGQDGESEHEFLTSNATSTMDEQYVGGAGSVPALNENMPVVTEVLTRSSDLEPEPMINISVGKVSCDTDGVCAQVGHSASTMSIEAPQTPAVTTITVDACEESIPDINKDAQIFGDIYGLENAQRVTDTENDILNELKVIEISEPFEGAPPKGSGIASPDMSIKQITEDTEMKAESDHASTDKKEHTVSPIDHYFDSGKFVEDFPNHVVDQLGHENPTREEHKATDSEGQLMGDFGDHGRLSAKEILSVTFGKEESPVGDTLLESPTFVKDDDRNKQEETQKATTSTDWVNYGFGMNEFHNPVIANENDDLLDDQISVLQTTARASSSIEGNYSPAADFVNSEKSEQGSRNVVVDTEFDQDTDMLKEKANANNIEELFIWPDSSLKALFTKPATTPSSHLKEGQQDAVSFDFPDNSHDEDIGRKGTPTLDSNHPALSLETLFTSPATTRITHVKDDQMENESSKVFNRKTQVTETQGQENVMNIVPNCDKFYNKYFGDEVDGSSDRSEEFKGDQYDLLSEAVRPGRLVTPGLKVNSIRRGMPEKKED